MNFSTKSHLDYIDKRSRSCFFCFTQSIPKTLTIEAIDEKEDSASKTVIDILDQVECSKVYESRKRNALGLLEIPPSKLIKESP